MPDANINNIAHIPPLSQEQLDALSNIAGAGSMESPNSEVALKQLFFTAGPQPDNILQLWMEPKAVCNDDSPAESNGGELNTGYTPYPLDKLGDSKMPHFGLLEKWTPNYETPARAYLDGQAPASSKKNQFACQYPGPCNGKQHVFSRPADLERHYKNVHADHPDLPCDCTKYLRALDFFTRKDHYRDHLRDFHKEDIGCGKGKLLRWDAAWERVDTGQHVPVTMRNWFCCYCGRVQLLDKDIKSNKLIPILGFSSGCLMSSSFVWLNKSMRLSEPSATLINIMNATHAGRIPESLPEAITDIPEGIIFAFFLLGTAGLTGTTVAWMRARNHVRLPTLGLTLAGAIASWVLGFSVEEVVLVCLPLVIGCSILCSSVPVLKRIDSAEKDEKAEPTSNV